MSFIGLHAFGITENYSGTVIPHFENSHKHISRYATKRVDEQQPDDAHDASPAAGLLPVFTAMAWVSHHTHDNPVFAHGGHSVKTKRFILLRSILI